MSTTETVNPYAPTDPPATAALPENRGRALASAIAVFLGGYLVLSGLSGQLSVAISGIGGGGPELAALLLLQLAFAVAVVVVGFFLAPATSGRRFLASTIVVIGVILTVVVIAGRISGVLRGGGIPLQLTIANAYFMTVLLVGAGWLIVRSARTGWLALLLAVVFIPIPFVFALANIGYAITTIVALFVTAIVGVVILAGGRPLRG